MTDPRTGSGANEPVEGDLSGSTTGLGATGRTDEDETTGETAVTAPTDG